MSSFARNVNAAFHFANHIPELLFLVLVQVAVYSAMAAVLLAVLGGIAWTIVSSIGSTLGLIFILILCLCGWPLIRAIFYAVFNVLPACCVRSLFETFREYWQRAFAAAQLSSVLR